MAKSRMARLSDLVISAGLALSGSCWAQGPVGAALEVRLATGGVVSLPGVPGPQTLAVFGLPSLDPISEIVATSVRTAGIGSTTEAMIRSFGIGSAQADFVQCQVIPGILPSDGAVGSLLGTVPAVRAGFVSFANTLQRCGGIAVPNDDVVFNSFYSVAPVIREGSLAGSLANVRIGAVFGTSAFTPVEILYYASLTGTGVTSATDRAIWSGSGPVSTSHRLIARTGQAVPGQASAPVFATLSGGTKGENEAVFWSQLGGAGVTASNDTSLWRYRTGSIIPGPREGQIVQNAAAVSLGDISFIFSAADGLVVFRSKLTGPSVTGTNDDALIASAFSSQALILAREGQQVPGLAAGVVYTAFRTEVTDGFRAMFIATIDGPGVTPSDDTVLVVADARNPGIPATVLARTGQPAPGSPAGSVFTAILEDGSSLVMARPDYVAFGARVNVPQGGTVVNQFGIWGGIGTSISEVVREGRTVTLPNQQIKTLASCGFTAGSGGADGRPAALGRRGGLVLRATFTDATQAIMLGRIAPVCPEFTAQNLPNVSARNGTRLVLGAGVRALPPLTYQWRLNGQPLADGPNITGATSATLTIERFTAADVGRYDLAATNGCGPVIGSPVDAALRCTADFDDGSGFGTPDGSVTIDDLLYYLPRFAAGEAAVDVDDGSGTSSPDGAVTIEDLLHFLARYEAGC